MPRIGEAAPNPVETLIPYLQTGVTGLIAAVCESLNKFDPLPFGVIPGFLTNEGLEMLEKLVAC